MANYSDFRDKNTKFTGTIGERISSGTTGERDTSTYGAGTLRYNTTTNLLEYYNGAEFKPIDAPPTISDVTPTNVLTSQAAQDSTTAITFTITGSQFGAGATVTFIGTDGSTVSADTVNVVSSSSIQATVNQRTSFSASVDPYDVKVQNLSGLNATLENQIDVNQAVTFTNAAGSLGSFANTSASVNVNAGGTDPEGGAITYSIISGSLPGWATINASTGVITGTTSGSGTETSTFTVKAVDAASNVSTRQFSITTRDPVVVSYTSGSGTFSVPAGVTSVDVLVVAGGGGGGSGTAGGGGAGGYVEVSSFPVTPGGSVPYGVGEGAPAVGNDGGVGYQGSNSTFGTLTAIGGGGGGSGWPARNGPPLDGGSGGGGTAYPTRNDGGASGNQPSQPGQSGTFGYGNPGAPGPSGGGGGGAAGAGNNYTGGAGRSSTISGSAVTRAGGGRGQGNNPSPSGGPHSGGGGGNNGNEGQSGQANTGGGGGGGWDFGSGDGGGGGSGIVIVKY